MLAPQRARVVRLASESASAVERLAIGVPTLYVERSQFCWHDQVACMHSCGPALCSCRCRGREPLMSESSCNDSMGSHVTWDGVMRGWGGGGGLAEGND